MENIRHNYLAGSIATFRLQSRGAKMKKANPIGRTGFAPNIQNESELSTSARQHGRNMGALYLSNVGGLDAFYKLFGLIEKQYDPHTRVSFLDGFFEVTQRDQEGGTDGND